MSVSAAHAKDRSRTITIAADEWCPVNCDPASERPGVGIEIARRIFAPAGYEVRYVTMSWSQALKDIADGNIDAVIGANRSDSPTLVFPEKPVAIVSDNIYMLTDTKVTCETLECLRPLRLGLIDGYGYNTELQKFIESRKATPGAIRYAQGDEGLDGNIALLRAGKIDALAESSLVMSYLLQKENLSDAVKSVYAMANEDVFLAFSPARKDARQLAGLFDAGMTNLEASGDVADIYGRYGLYLD